MLNEIKWLSSSKRILAHSNEALPKDSNLNLDQGCIFQKILKIHLKLLSTSLIDIPTINAMEEFYGLPTF